MRNLDAASFAAREAASAELLHLADRIEPRLRAARASASVEARRRIDAILENLGRPTRRQLRESRALTVLATPEAALVVELLAAGDQEDPLCQSAARARHRLIGR
jgi:hypothetical protein